MTKEIRAASLSVGDKYAEDGMDPVTIVAIDYHGDAVLIQGAAGEETTLDIDTVVVLNPEDDDMTDQCASSMAKCL